MHNLQKIWQGHLRGDRHVCSKKGSAHLSSPLVHIFNSWSNFQEQLEIQGGHLQPLGLASEIDKQEIDRDATEQEQEDVQELGLGVLNNGCQHQVERSKEHDDRDDGGDLPETQRLDDGEARDRVCGPWALSLPPACLPVASTFHQLPSSCPCHHTLPSQKSHLLGYGGHPRSRGFGTQLDLLCAL